MIGYWILDKSCWLFDGTLDNVGIITALTSVIGTIIGDNTLTIPFLSNDYPIQSKFFDNWMGIYTVYIYYIYYIIKHEFEKKHPNSSM